MSNDELLIQEFLNQIKDDEQLNPVSWNWDRSTYQIAFSNTVEFNDNNLIAYLDYSTNEDNNGIEVTIEPIIYFETKYLSFRDSLLSLTSKMKTMHQQGHGRLTNIQALQKFVNKVNTDYPDQILTIHYANPEIKKHQAEPTELVSYPTDHPNDDDYAIGDFDLQQLATTIYINPDVDTEPNANELHDCYEIFSNIIQQYFYTFLKH